MNNHPRQPQETQLRQKTLKALCCNAFRLLKIGFLVFFTSFSPYFRSTTGILYNKKTQKPLCLLRFRALLFFPIKTDNPLILSIFISLVYLKISYPVPLFFSFTVEKDLSETLINKGFRGATKFPKTLFLKEKVSRYWFENRDCCAPINRSSQ
jgi:hypothetical protein